MRRRLAATIAALTVLITGAAAPAGGAEPPPEPSVPVMPGIGVSSGMTVIGDQAIFVIAHEEGGGDRDGVLFTRSLAADATTVTLGRTTRVARTSGFRMAEHDGTLAYNRRVDGALVLRAPDGTEIRPAWGVAPEIVDNGPSSLSGTWLAAGSTVFALADGASYDLMDAVTDLPPEGTRIQTRNVSVSEDRALWGVLIDVPHVPAPGIDTLYYVYTVGLGPDGPVGPALQLDATSGRFDRPQAIGIANSSLVWWRNVWVSVPGSPVSQDTAIVSSVPAASPESVPVQRTFGPYPNGIDVMPAGDEVAVFTRHEDYAGFDMWWFDPAAPATDVYATSKRTTADFVRPGVTSGGLLTTVSEVMPPPPADSIYTHTIEDVAGRTIVHDDSGPLPQPTFSDVQAGHPFAGDISWITDLGITSGYADGTYRPTAPVTRQAMAAFLYRLAGEPAFVPPATSPFRDVQTKHPFYKEIAWLASTGISTGTVTPTGAYFKPRDAVSRGAMAAFLYRFAGEPSVGTGIYLPFADIGGHPFHTEIEFMWQYGISRGTHEGIYMTTYYKPDEPVSRGAMATFMHRLHSKGLTISWHVS